MMTPPTPVLPRSLVSPLLSEAAASRELAERGVRDLEAAAESRGKVQELVDSDPPHEKRKKSRRWLFLDGEVLNVGVLEDVEKGVL